MLLGFWFWFKLYGLSFATWMNIALNFCSNIVLLMELFVGNSPRFEWFLAFFYYLMVVMVDGYIFVSTHTNKKSTIHTYIYMYTGTVGTCTCTYTCTLLALYVLVVAVAIFSLFFFFFFLKIQMNSFWNFQNLPVWIFNWKSPIHTQTHSHTEPHQQYLEN